MDELLYVLVDNMAEDGESDVLETVAEALEARAENAATNHKDSALADALYGAAKKVRAVADDLAL